MHTVSVPPSERLALSWDWTAAPVNVKWEVTAQEGKMGGRSQPSLTRRWGVPRGFDRVSKEREGKGR